MSERLVLIKLLSQKLGLERLAEIEVAAIRRRAVPERLLHRLTEPDDLTPRQRECLVLLASGYTRQEMADELGIRVSTVKTHLSHSYARLDVHNAMQAVNAFIEREA